MREAYRDAALARDYERARSANLGQRARASLERSLVRRALASLPRDSRILDVACGTGRLAPLLAGHGASLVGVDSSREMLAEAARHGLATARWVQGDATRLPFRDASFDVVTSCRFLRHLDAAGRTAVFRELARVSRRLVVVELLLGEGLVWATKRAVHDRAWSDARAHQRPADAEARRELEAAGLRVRRRHALIPWVSQPHFFVCEVARGSE